MPAACPVGTLRQVTPLPTAKDCGKVYSRAVSKYGIVILL